MSHLGTLLLSRTILNVLLNYMRALMWKYHIHLSRSCTKVYMRTSSMFLYKTITCKFDKFYIQGHCWPLRIDGTNKEIRNVPFIRADGKYIQNFNVNLKFGNSSILTLRLLMSYIYIYIYIYIYGAPILDVSRSHTTTHHSR